MEQIKSSFLVHSVTVSNTHFNHNNHFCLCNVRTKCVTSLYHRITWSNCPRPMLRHSATYTASSVGTSLAVMILLSNIRQCSYIWIGNCSAYSDGTVNDKRDIQQIVKIKYRRYLNHIHLIFFTNSDVLHSISCMIPHFPVMACKKVM